MKIVVYCSAKDAIPEEFLALGDALGTWIGENGHTLIYGGATGGLMTRTSNAAKAAGAMVIGVYGHRGHSSAHQSGGTKGGQLRRAVHGAEYVRAQTDHA